MADPLLSRPPTTAAAVTTRSAAIARRSVLLERFLPGLEALARLDTLAQNFSQDKRSFHTLFWGIEHLGSFSHADGH